MKISGGTPNAPRQPQERSADNSVSVTIESLNLEVPSNKRFNSIREELDLVFSIQEKLTSLPPQSSEACIFMVPEKLRQGNKESYTPRVVSIGPYHRRNSGVMQMEGHKLWYLKIFLEHIQKCSLKDYIERIRSWEDRARSCYNRQINLSPNEFAKMMLLDGIFVIQLFLMFWNSQWRLDGDQIFSMPLMVNDIRRDLLLLENQMPFFAVEGLFEMAFGSHQKHMPRLLELTYKFFGTGMKIEELPEAVMESEPKHFLDAIRLLYLPSEREAPYHFLEVIEFIPSATELAAAGIKLRRGKSKGFNVKFQNGVLEIPCLNLNKLESYFRNIIAFEQCYYPVDSYLNDYMVFMDHLVNTPSDAKLLINKRIIEHWLGNENAATDLINSFCKDTFHWTRNPYFNSLRHELVEHCRRPYNKWKASFKRDYCSSPWKVLSIIAAVVLLVLTFVQTVCSLLSFK